jgi:predicted MFS family arabinose efflux permease
VYTVMQIPTGMLVDTLGTRKVLVAGGLLAALGSLLFSMAGDLQLALWGRTLTGLGVSVTFIAMLKLLALHYEEHRFSSLVGVCMLIGNSGSVLAGRPLGEAAQLIGWRTVFQGIAGASFLLAILCWYLIKENPVSPTASETPTPQIWDGLRQILKNRATWPAVLVNLGMSGTFFTFGGLWAGPWLQQVQGLSSSQASQVVSLYFAGFAIGTLLVGWGSDTLQKRRPIMLIGSHVYWLVWLGIAAALPITPLALQFGAPLFGIITASFVLTWPCAKEVNPPAYSGMSTAVTNMGGFSGAAVLLPLVGWIMDKQWDGRLENGLRQYQPHDFSVGLSCLCVAAGLAALASWFIRETHCRHQSATAAATAPTTAPTIKAD